MPITSWYVQSIGNLICNVVIMPIDIDINLIKLDNFISNIRITY